MFFDDQPRSSGLVSARIAVKITMSVVFLSSGAIAQLGERVVRNDEAVGSIPTSSTKDSITCNSSVNQIWSTTVQFKESSFPSLRYGLERSIKTGIVVGANADFII